MKVPLNFYTKREDPYFISLMLIHSPCIPTYLWKILISCVVFLNTSFWYLAWRWGRDIIESRFYFMINVRPRKVFDFIRYLTILRAINEVLYLSNKVGFKIKNIRRVNFSIKTNVITFDFKVCVHFSKIDCRCSVVK